MFPTTLTADYTISFEYSKIIVDYSDFVLIAKNANFNINEWFLFDIIADLGWAFYDKDNNVFHPTDVTGEFIDNITKFDTKNERDKPKVTGLVFLRVMISAELRQFQGKKGIY